MKISYYTEESNLDKSVGYGNAGFNIVTSLQALGHEVPFNSKDAKVQIAFCNPVTTKFYDHQYKIIYTPWESTGLPDGWLEKFNSVDEVWATSDWTAQVYKNAGVKTPIYVYEHGISKGWQQPVRRERSDVLKFLHMGEPAPRKGGQMTVDAFREVFGTREDVSLTLKCHWKNFTGTWVDGHPQRTEKLNNVQVFKDEFYDFELVNLFLDHDVLVYPSWGEGFGLIPLQSLATGMPTICTSEWAPYKRFIMPLASTPIQSPWFFHPGKLMLPDYDELMKYFKYLDGPGFEYEAEAAFNQTDNLYRDFDWLTLTEKAFEHITEKEF
jgi:hypothetical protein